MQDQGKSSDSRRQWPVLKKNSKSVTQISNKNSNFAHKTEKKMKKYNYDRLKDAYRQFSTAETEYMKACNQDDEQNQWEKEEILNACTDILTVTVKEVLEDEEDFIQ
jgi:hypothetical protein